MTFGGCQQSARKQLSDWLCYMAVLGNQERAYTQDIISRDVYVKMDMQQNSYKNKNERIRNI